jgi:hypothetical protein
VPDRAGQEAPDSAGDVDNLGHLSKNPVTDLSIN